MTLKILQIKDTCTGCGACVSICPKSALTLEYDESGYYYPKLEESKCIDCNTCDKVCHVINNKIPINPSKKYTAYMLKANDKCIVKRSSSGGAFTLLSNEVLAQGGVVYGARYNFSNERLEHVSTDMFSLDELRKSKYIESYMGQTCKDVLEQLKKGRHVLFCGTPCQVEGLHNYLKSKRIDTSNLLLVRFVCHGVPSNKFFTEYKHFEEKKHKSKMVSFDFRPKTRGWRNSDWLMKFENGKVESGPYYYYYYYYYFQLSDLLRPSCYSCKRIYHEVADVTIGDFWGIHMYKPENLDQEGISLVLVHTEKAKELVSHIGHKCNSELVPLSALDYIYQEAQGRHNHLEKHKETMKNVLRYGYMNVAKKVLGPQIRKIKLKQYLSNHLQIFKKWIRRK